MSYNFNNALLRTPAKSITRAISKKGIQPKFDEIMSEHNAYLEALKGLGIQVLLLPPTEDYPDSVFVEDPALTFKNGCVILRPGAKTRFGEKDHLAETLQGIFTNIFFVSEGAVEGGDILRIGNHCIIGLSGRTDEVGARFLSKKLLEIDISCEITVTPPSVLHFKSDCCLIDENTIFCTERLSETGFFRGKGYEVVKVPRGEEMAANSLRVNDTIFVPEGFEQTANLLSKRYNVTFLKVSEVAKVDAGLSCMSLRW